MSESAEYQIVTDSDRSLPTIVNSEGRSILAIDWRVVDHRGVRTPVFADPSIAARVLAMLNDHPGRSEAEIKAEALREAAEEMAAIIAAGDMAEIADPVPGEIGRAVAMTKRDFLYNDPHEWMVDYTARVAGATGD